MLRPPLLLLVLSFLVSMNPLPAAPANPLATERTRAVLDYLVGLEARTEQRVLSGQFTDFGANASLAIMEKIQERTGHWPALIGVDYVDFPSGGLTTAIPNAVALAHWRGGGLVSVTTHLPNPANPKGGGLRDQGVDLNDLLAPGTATHERWMRELDTIAAGLAELRDAGVVVFWRPFHEMNGGWFWWGDKPPADFIRVWRHMFDYFTHTKGLNNLLWVYNPNHGPKTAELYPGDDVVDVIGFDVYKDDVDPTHIFGYDALARIKKPFGFGEFGPHGSEKPPGDYDYRRFLDGVKRHFPRTTYFMSWNANWSLATNLHVQELLDDPWIVNRADLPRALTAPPATP